MKLTDWIKKAWASDRTLWVLAFVCLLAATTPQYWPVFKVYDAVQMGSLSAAVSACGSSTCTVSVSQNITTSTVTVPRNVSLHIFGNGLITVSSGQTLTINGGIIAANNTQLFAGSGTVALGPLLDVVPPEWFGAVADWNGSTGTDNTAAFNLTVNALTSGCMKLSAAPYKVTGTTTISKSNVGICGSGIGYGYQSTAGISRIVSTSASADIIDVSGTVGTYLLWNVFKNFDLERTVLPTGTATGLSINYVGGYTIDHVQVNDNVRNYYFHGAPYYGVGGVSNTMSVHNNRGVTGYTGTVYDYYLDSSDGVCSGTFTGNNMTASGTSGFTTGFTDIAYYATGTCLADENITYFSSFLTNYGVYLNCTGGSGSLCGDINFVNPVLDSWSQDGIFVTGITAALGSVNFIGGWNSSALTASSAVQINGSSGVSVQGMQMAIAGNQATNIGNSSFLQFNSNQVFSGSEAAFGASGMLYSTVNDNVFHNTAGNSFTEAIALSSGSNYNAISGNIIGCTTVAGIAFDATSINNTYAGNTFAPCQAAATVSDAGTNNGLNHVGRAYFSGITSARPIVFQPNANVSAAPTIQGVNAAGSTVTWQIDQIGNPSFQSWTNLQTVTFTALTNAGTGATTPTCVTGLTCSPSAGQASFTTGTGPALGDFFRVNWSTAFPHKAVCLFQVFDASSGANVQTALYDSGSAATTSGTAYSTAALTASHSINVTYMCQ